MKYLVLVLAFVTVSAILWGILYFVSIKRENMYLENYISVLQEYYLAMEQQVHTMRKYRHDIGKHINMLKYLRDCKDDEHVSNQLQQLQQSYPVQESKYYCNHVVLNALLNLLEEKCQQKKITLEIQTEEQLSWGEKSDVYLVGLLPNLFDNAMEACENASEENRWIRFTLKREEGKISISVINGVEDGNSITFQTKKEAKEEHGYGLRIIKELVAKNKGTMQVKKEKNRIDFQIILPEKV